MRQCPDVLAWLMYEEVVEVVEVWHTRNQEQRFDCLDPTSAVKEDH